MLQDYQLLMVPHVNTYGHNYATGRYDYLKILNQNNSETNFICPCPNGGGKSGPSSHYYVGMNYYCESGTDDQVHHNEYYLTDALWDGSYRMYKQ